LKVIIEKEGYSSYFKNGDTSIYGV